MGKLIVAFRNLTNVSKTEFIDENDHSDGAVLQSKTETLVEKSGPLPLCLPQYL